MAFDDDDEQGSSTSLARQTSNHIPTAVPAAVVLPWGLHVGSWQDSGGCQHLCTAGGRLEQTEPPRQASVWLALKQT